jgi:N,N-dimethylformamidase beta subunit-like protein
MKTLKRHTFSVIILLAAVIIASLMTLCSFQLLLKNINATQLSSQNIVSLAHKTIKVEYETPTTLVSGKSIMPNPIHQRISLPLFEKKNDNVISSLPQQQQQETSEHTGKILNKGKSIALVLPTFTAAAYNNSFYIFYQRYAHIPYGTNVTKDLNLLSSKVIITNLTSTTTTRSTFTIPELIDSLKKKNITILTDPDVDKGFIFKRNNANLYDVIILGHQEYVTQKEYDNLRKFVVDGGTMIILDGNVFYAEVKYDRIDQTITLVKGHWWAFNGKSAWKSIGERWKEQTAQWVGSNYLCYECVGKFENDPFGYRPHEEQYITNLRDIILLNYNASIVLFGDQHLMKSKPVVATYELNYGKGKVIALGIYSDDILLNDKFDIYLHNLLVQNGIIFGD